MALRSPQEELAKITLPAQQRLTAIYSDCNPSYAEAVVAFADVLGRYKYTEVNYSTRHTSPEELPAAADYRCDVESCARAVLTPQQFIVFKACWVRGVITETEIPFDHSADIQVKVGCELLRRGVIANGSVDDYLHKPCSVLLSKHERREKLQREAISAAKRHLDDKETVTVDGRKRRISSKPDRLHDDGVKRLWTNVLLTAVEDMRDPNPKNFSQAVDALDWLFEDQRSLLCFHMLGIDPQTFRKMIMKFDGTRVQQIVEQFKQQKSIELEQAA